MKITKQQLKVIIKEELAAMMSGGPSQQEMEALAQAVMAAYNPQSPPYPTNMDAFLASQEASQALESAKDMDGLSDAVAGVSVEDLRDMILSMA
jgi:hypothetical protein